MKPRPTDPAQRSGYGSISIGEALPVREVGRRLGWGSKTIAQAQRDGLRTTLYGRIRYTTGQAVLDFITGLMAKQGEQQNENSNP